MIPLTIKPPPIQQQHESPKLSIDMAEQIADRAARRAAEETVSKTQEISRENMDNYNRFHEQNNQQNNQQNRQSPIEKDSIYEEPEGGYSIDTKTEKNLMRRLLDQTLQKALDPPPPNPVEAAVGNVMSRVTEGIAERMLGNLGGVNSGSAVTKTSFIIEVLNSQFGAGLGQTLGNNLPGVIQSLTGAIGQKKTEELVDNINSKMSANQQQNVESSNVEKQKDMVLALDSNNPDHIRQYAAAMGLTEKAAKGMLQIHQDDIINERKIFSGSNSSNVNNNELTQALITLTQEMSGMKAVVGNLQNELLIMKGGKPIESSVEIDTDSRWNDNTQQQINVSTSSVGRNVNLFSTPIKVDVDQIKGNNDPFFNDSSKEKENINLATTKKITAKPVMEIETSEPEKNDQKWSEESVLEETKDAEGNSTFRMSNEPEKVVVVIPSENVKVPEVKEEVKEKVTNIDKNSEVIQQKKIIKRQVPIRKKEEPSKQQDLHSESQKENKQEHYDINNNLIVEDKT